MASQAHGSFDVKIAAQPNPEESGGPAVGRLNLFKEFHGDLVATAHGQMLAVRTAVEGSGAYVAMDYVVGTLAGKQGSFVLMHVGTMGHGERMLTIKVVEDSGTDQLVGLSGTLDIIVKDGSHSYVFDYTV